MLEPLGGYLHLGRQLGGPKGADFCESWNFGPNNSANKNVGEVVQDVIRLWGSGQVKIERDPNAPHEDHWLQLNCDRANHYLKLESDLELPRFDRRDGELVSPLSGGRRHCRPHRFADREVRPRLEGGGP